jgi:subtilisin family serine protease
MMKNTVRRAKELLSLSAVNVLCFFLLVFLPANLSAQEKMEIAGKTYTKEQEKWFVEDAGQRYEVNPRVITVRFGAGMTAAARSSFYSQHGFTQIRTNPLGYVDLEVPEGTSPLEYVQQLKEEAGVVSAEVNTFGKYLPVMDPNDPKASDQWHLPHTRVAPNPTESAWEITTGSPGIIIAVLDSGTDVGHEDLKGNIWINPGEDIDGDGAIVPANPDHLDNDDKNAVDDDGNGKVDDLVGWDFSNNNNNVRGPFYHGTHVAGIVGATSNNGIGLSGVAGGWGSSKGCQIMAVGVGDFAPDGSALDDAIIYAADNGARIITLSLSIASSAAIDAAIDYAYDQKGVFINNAAGNDSAGVAYPATHADVVAVSATNQSDIISSFSNRGPEIELAAPGEVIWSTRLNNSYGEGPGTSYASPQVAGVAGLLLSCKPSLTNTEVKSFLETGAVDLGDPGRDDLYGFGRLDALAALRAAGCGVTQINCRTNALQLPTKGSGQTLVYWGLLLLPAVLGGWLALTGLRRREAATV